MKKAKGIGKGLTAFLIILALALGIGGTYLACNWNTITAPKTDTETNEQAPEIENDEGVELTIR